MPDITASKTLSHVSDMKPKNCEFRGVLSPKTWLFVNKYFSFIFYSFPLGFFSKSFKKFNHRFILIATYFHQSSTFPEDTRRRFNVYKTSIRCQRRRIDVLQLLKRRRVSTGLFRSVLLFRPYGRVC